MFIDQSMTRRVITIDKEMGIPEAGELMAKNHIRHLPVVESDNKLIGIVTDRDVRSAMPSVALNECSPAEKEKFLKLTVKDIMTADVVSITPLYTLQDALLLMHETTVGAFPVIDENGILKGIISIRDLMRAFVNVLGIKESGTLVGVLVDDKAGQMKKIVDAITEENISTGSILVARHWKDEQQAVFPYLLTMNVTAVKKKLEKMGFKLIDPMEWYLDQVPKND